MEQVGVEGIFVTNEFNKGIREYNDGLTQATKKSTDFAREVETALKQAEEAAKKAAQAYNKDYVGGLNRGSATTRDFQAALMSSAQEMGLSTNQLSRMAQASGLYSAEQLKAAESSRNLAKRADELNKAVAAGDMTAEQAGKEFAAYAKTQEVSAKSAEKATKSYQGLKTALVGIVSVAAVTATAKKVLDWSKEGAAALQTQRSFDNLLRTIGAAPDLLSRLSAAANGTVDDMTLMSATSTLLAGTQGKLALALAEGTPQLLEIAKAANKLNPSLGDTTFMYESLALGIKRASPMILDNLGITLKVSEAYDKFAASIGKKADQLTKDEQAQALLNATLAKGSVLIAQAGGSANSATDAYAQLEAQTKNLTDAFKMYLTEGITPALQPVAEYLQSSLEFGKAQQRFKEAVEAGTISAAEQSEIISKLRWYKISDAEATQFLADKEKIASGAVDDSVNSYEKYVELVKEGAKQTQVMANRLEAYEGQVKGGQMSTEDMTVALGGLTEAEFRLVRDTRLADKYAFRIPNAMSASGEAVSALGGQVDDLAAKEKALADAQALVDQSMSELQFTVDGKLGPSMVTYTEKQADLNEKVKEYTAEIQRLSGLPSPTKDETEALEENKDKLAEVEDQIKKNADAHDEATRRILFDILQQRAAIDGLTSGEVELLTQVALKWGLIDTATADAMKNADQALTDFAKGQGVYETISQLETANGLAKGIYSSLRDMNGKTFSASVVIETSYSGAPVYTEQAKPGKVSKPGEKGKPESYAKGANFVVPPGYRENYPIGWASSGEQVIIIPKPKMTGASPVNYSPRMAAQPISPSYNNTANVNMGGVNIYNGMGEAQLAAMIRSVVRSQFAGG